MLQSLNELHHLTGINREVIRRRLADIEHKPGPNRARLYDSAIVLPILYGVGGERLDPAQERAQLDRERRRQVELANRQKAGELVAVDEVADLWREEVSRLRSRLLHLPSRAAPTVFGLESLREVERTLRDAVHAALADVSGFDGTP